jgi:hypothetical protein
VAGASGPAHATGTQAAGHAGAVDSSAAQAGADGAPGARLTTPDAAGGQRAGHPPIQQALDLAKQHHTAIAGHAATVQLSFTTRQSNWPKPIGPTSISSVQFGFPTARTLIDSRHLDFRAHTGNAGLVCGATTVKYPGKAIARSAQSSRANRADMRTKSLHMLSPHPNLRTDERGASCASLQGGTGFVRPLAATVRGKRCVFGSPRRAPARLRCVGRVDSSVPRTCMAPGLALPWR